MPTGEVFVRTSDGGEARQISHAVAERLVAARLADVVSSAGHVRLKPGFSSSKISEFTDFARSSSCGATLATKEPRVG